jgi:hypothetical protein
MSSRQSGKEKAKTAEDAEEDDTKDLGKKLPVQALNRDGIFHHRLYSVESKHFQEENRRRGAHGNA